jgi:hypothetical protein
LTPENRVYILSITRVEDPHQVLITKKHRVDIDHHLHNRV